MSVPEEHNIPNDRDETPFQEELQNDRRAREHLDISDLNDITLTVSAELGRCPMYVRDVLELKRGSVVTLDKVAGELADIYVNGMPIAKGEIVVVVDSITVRVAEVRGAAEKEEEEEA